MSRASVISPITRPWSSISGVVLMDTRTVSPLFLRRSAGRLRRLAGADAGEEATVVRVRQIGGMQGAQRTAIASSP